ncbi:hypothetical protein [Pseudochryseolinea flava]|uniref:Uncharacterized protein n=1 Tax=Pseudochryseolinea flava TaxID=2059302 RepID=A0A364Y1M6_9BACT|nr:hypothetical protein [Pseudochryseolinea flava]RAW00638.1 hypothetical protein DQQ10_13690 [Pseudochryseolinea flava]
MKKLSWLFLMVLIPFACQEEREDVIDQSDLKEFTTETIKIIRNKNNGRLITTTGVNCEQSTTFVIAVPNVSEEGYGTVSVHAEEIVIDYDLSLSEWYLVNVKVYAGDCNAIPDPANFPYGQTYPMDNEVRAGSLSIPMSSLPDCGCIQIAVTIGRFSPINSELETVTSTSSTDYCNCDEPEEPEDPDDKNLRTQTPGGWGAPPNGDNPGVYLHANFAAAFPNGIVLGCDHTITLTSAHAVTNFLPQGGQPGALTKSYVNPVNTNKSSNNPKNVLASHVTALTLSTGFDSWDADFGDSSSNLINSTITSGTFEGWTVSEVLAEANKVLGGCASSYSASQLTEVLTAINECYVDGSTNTGFLQNQ